jgi:hypothetical protein
MCDEYNFLSSSHEKCYAYLVDSNEFTAKRPAFLPRLGGDE